MTLIKSVSGIRGTIGGKVGENLTPIDVVKLTTAYAVLLKQKYHTEKPTVAVGRDGRISGPLILELVANSLQQSGIEVINIDLTTTPTLEYFVQENENIHGGIITSASHNTREWNALKLLNADGEFLNQVDGEFILEKSEQELFFNEVDTLGKRTVSTQSFPLHLKGILSLPYVLTEEIKNRKFKVIVDGINSSGGVFVPELLNALGVETETIHGMPTGEFAHNPEPLKQNLTDLIDKVKSSEADMGIAVDPDVDRLVLVCENGEMFGEEYTLVAAADHFLDYEKTPLVSNMSSSLALRDLAKSKGVEYFSAKVGELYVVELMKKVGCKIGGEGNGGVILGDLHYGRDALVGIAMVLSKLAKEKNFTF